MGAVSILLTSARRAKYLAATTALRNLPQRLAEVLVMGRRPEGWKVFDKRGWFYVRFTHAGVEHRIALATKDRAEADKRAPIEYSKIVLGRAPTRESTRDLTNAKLEDVFSEYVDVTDGSLDDETRKTLRIYARKFVAHFGESLGNVNEQTIAEYGRKRLREVLRTTVLKERSALRTFLSWCKDERKLIAEVPHFVDLPKKATGVRVGKQRAKPVEITAAEACDIIAGLPELSKSIDGRKWPVRLRYLVAWETGLRPETLARLSAPQNYVRGSSEIVMDNDDDKARYGRAVPLSVLARAALDKVAPDSGLIFGKHNFAKALKRSALRVLGAEKAKRFAQYDFRHGRATQLAEETGNLPGVAYLLGHRRLTTTDKYLRGSRRAAENVLAAIDGPNSPPHGVQMKQILGGDRRGSNPRQLEPQSSDVAILASFALEDAPSELRVAAPGAGFRPGGGFVDALHEAFATSCVVDDFLETFSDVDAAELSPVVDEKETA